jgi:serine/threonine protein kinase
VTAENVCGYRLLRELGARALPSYAAVDPKGRRGADALCVVERLARGPGVSAESAAEFLRDAKRLAELTHANLVHVRGVVVGTSTVLLISDWLEGELLSDIERRAAEQSVPITLAVRLRILIDLLEGLSALHELRDAKREPLRLVHAEVAPQNLVVGVDGRSVLVHPLRAPAGEPRRTTPGVVGYLAPEVLLADQTADQRADVYGAGVLLWEALMGHRMHAEGEDAGEIVMRLLGGRIASPVPPVDAPWAGPLAAVAKRAVAPDPSVRFANATEMLAEVRRVALARVAPKVVVAALVDAVAGARIRARTSALVASVGREPGTTDATDSADSPPVARDLPLSRGADPEAITPPLAAVRAPPHAPAAPSSRPRVTPSWGRVRTAPSSHAPISSAPAAPLEVEDLAIEVEMPPDPPAAPQAPPPAARDVLVPPPAPPVQTTRLERPITPSKTDLAALVSARSTPRMSRATWIIAAGCVLAAVAVLWMLARGGPAPTESSEPPAASLAPIASESPALSAIPTAARPEPSAAVDQAARSPEVPSRGSDPGPFDPAPTEAHPRPGPGAAPAPFAPPLPTVPPSPVPPSPAASAPPAPAGSSPHPKKRVYDPQGI